MMIICVFLLFLSYSRAISLPDSVIAFGSCNRGNLTSIWHLLSEYNPTKLILLGDNIYVDIKLGITKFERARPEMIESGYIQLKENPDFSALVKQIGGIENIFAVWDDHDYGINNGNSLYEFRDISMQYFNDFFQVPIDKRRSDGIYSSHTIPIHTRNGKIFNIKLIMLDVRYNKVEDKSPFASKENCQILGENQWSWFEDSISYSSLVKDDIDFVLVGSGTQISPDSKFYEEIWLNDCFKDRERMLNAISRTILASKRACEEGSTSRHCKSKGLDVLMLSGDVHSAEMSQLFCRLNPNDADDRSYYQLNEITSSGLTHTFTHVLQLADPEYFKGSERVLKMSGISAMPQIYDFYQSVSSAHHRKDKEADHYHFPHFGLLEFYISDDSTPRVVTKIVSYKNETVMEREIELRSWTDYNSLGSGLSPAPEGLKQIFSGKTADIFNNQLNYFSYHSNCMPYHGKTPAIKVIWVRFSIALMIFLIIVIPVLGAVWLVGASLYYVLFGAEIRRREKILLRNDKMKEM